MPAKKKQEKKIRQRPNKEENKKTSKEVDSDGDSFESPKKAASAYLFFVKDHRHKVVEDNLDASFKEISQILTSAWNECKNPEKFEALAYKDRVRYTKQSSEYEQTGFFHDDSGNSIKLKRKPQKRKQILLN